MLALRAAVFYDLFAYSGDLRKSQKKKHKGGFRMPKWNNLLHLCGFRFVKSVLPYVP